MSVRRLFLLGGILFFCINPSSLQAQLSVSIESGLVFGGYNDVRIPNETGTLFSLTDELKSDPTIYARTRLFYRLGRRHDVGVLFAPLTLQANGQLEQDVDFAGARFKGNTDVSAIYRFNSYRATYRYRLVERSSVTLALGATVKIRDAEISLESDTVEASKTNFGFVPLIHYYLKWGWSPGLSLILQGDALAAPQGRAEDLLFALEFHPTSAISLRLGYRLLEGGADVDEVYNFALLHYAVFGLVVSV